MKVNLSNVPIIVYLPFAGHTKKADIHGAIQQMIQLYRLAFLYTFMNIDVRG